MNRFTHKIRFAVAILVTALPGIWVAAATTALKVQNVTETENGDFVLGFRFSIEHRVHVTHLGKFDADGDGHLPNASRVALWRESTRSMIVEATVPAGNEAELEAGFFYVPIAPQRLEPGGYVLAVQTFAGGESFSSNAELAVGRGIGSLQSRYKVSPFVRFPNLRRSDDTPLLGPNFKFTDLVLNKIAERRVFQRTFENRAWIPLTGTFPGPADRLEARVVAREGFAGSDIDWTPVTRDLDGSGINGGLWVEGGGWYQLELRAVSDGEISDQTRVERFGVGEVFVMAGQSNSANSGTPPLVPEDDRVTRPAVLTAPGDDWVAASDPQPFASGAGGSPWPSMGDRLAEAFGVPIGMISVGVGTTTVAQWQPSTPNYPRLKEALTFLGPNGFRAVLWHQGESDTLAGTGPAQYAALLQNVIRASRADAGWAVPWAVALVGFVPGGTAKMQANVVAGQRLSIEEDALVFEGPNTDELGASWRSDTVHFNEAGLREHGRLWADFIEPIREQLDLRFSSARMEAGRLLLAWPGGERVRLQKTATMAPPDWRDVEVEPGAVGSIQTLENSRAFYRLWLQP